MCTILALCLIRIVLPLVILVAIGEYLDRRTMMGDTV
jgi:uncharacterized protein YneF (UPF0154 family)